MRVIVNAAMSADGKIALRGGAPLRLSDEADLQRVHRLRAQCDAILVGIGTVLADNPRLSARTSPPTLRQPLRVVLDSQARTPEDSHVLDGSAKTLILTAKGRARAFPNAECVEAGEGRVDVRLALRELQARGVQTLLVEGGATVIASFLRAGLVNDLYTYVAPAIVGGGAPTLVEGSGASAPEHLLRLRVADVHTLGEGVVIHYVPR